MPSAGDLDGGASATAAGTLDPGVVRGAGTARAVRRHLFAVTVVVCSALVGYMIWADLQPNSSLVVLVFLTGALGGLLSVYRRFRLLAPPPGAEAAAEPAHGLLLHAYLSPMLGGIFGVILYLVMLTGIIEGDFFPRFRNLDREYEGLFALFDSTVPAENKDAIKAVFWAFIAGFSERFVPDLVGRVGRR